MEYGFWNRYNMYPSGLVWPQPTTKPHTNNSILASQFGWFPWHACSWYLPNLVLAHSALASPCRDTARQLLFCYHLSTESIPSISRPSCTPTRPQNGNDKIKPQCLYLFVGFVVTQGWYHRVTQLCTVCLRDFNDVSRKFPQYLENSLNSAFPSLK